MSEQTVGQSLFPHGREVREGARLEVAHQEEEMETMATPRTHLYLLRANERHEAFRGDWHDKVFQIIVRASSEEEARQLAAAASGAEGPMVWRDPFATACDVLTAQGPVGVILHNIMVS